MLCIKKLLDCEKPRAPMQINILLCVVQHGRIFPAHQAYLRMSTSVIDHNVCHNLDVVVMEIAQTFSQLAFCAVLAIQIIQVSRKVALIADSIAGGWQPDRADTGACYLFGLVHQNLVPLFSPRLPIESLKNNFMTTASCRPRTCSASSLQGVKLIEPSVKDRTMLPNLSDFEEYNRSNKRQMRSARLSGAMSDGMKKTCVCSKNCTRPLVLWISHFNERGAPSGNTGIFHVFWILNVTRLLAICRKSRYQYEYDYDHIDQDCWQQVLGPCGSFE